MYLSIRRFVGAFLLTSMISCVDEPPYFIPGSATLPSCTEPPAFNLEGSWSDGGQVTIETTGCDAAQPGGVFESCPLEWVMTQAGQDIEILVDYEYIILGRLCGNALHLEGGWWLPVKDEGECYEEDSAAEVGIQMGSSTLVVMVEERGTDLIATGILQVGGPCEAAYDIVLRRFN
jgi:hypothetical protein